jgi:hypothetical protein
MKNLSTLKISVLCLTLGACAAPDEWPTVSFGNDITATNQAIAARPEVSLAPLPGLLPEDTRGVDDPALYMRSINADYRALVTKLSDRFQDYSKARKSMTVDTGEAFAESWLGAQMELSNISQYTEDLTKMRARITALGDPLPEGARVLLARIEAQELQNRLFIREEKLELAALEPS